MMSKGLSISIQDWMDSINQENIRKIDFDIKKLLKNSLYYPSSGFDGLPINYFSKEIRSFIYVEKNELSPNGWTPDFDVNQGDPKEFLNSRLEPFCEWIIFEINDIKCSLIFLCADGVAAYQALFTQNSIAPTIIALIQTGVIHGNWTNYSDPNKIFHKTAIRNSIPRPKFILHGGYYQLAGDKLYFRQPCWPEYTNKVLSIPKKTFDPVYKKIFNGQVILWKFNNSLSADTINIKKINLFESKKVIPKMRVWHNLYSQLIRNQDKEHKLPNPLMFQYMAEEKYISKEFIFKWHIAYAEFTNNTNFLNEFLSEIKPSEWEIVLF